MTPEQFIWWKKGMEDAARISNEEHIRRKDINYDTAQSAASMAELITHKINREVTTEETRRNEVNKIMAIAIHPTHKVVSSHTGNYCKKCGCEGNLIKP